MSEEWIYYPCQMGEHTAFIFYDHGIRECIDKDAPPNFLTIRAKFKNPRPDGFSSREEYQQLCELEDELTRVVNEDNGLYVGRITVAGYRHFHVFTQRGEADWSEKLNLVRDLLGYELHCCCTPDAKRDGYWRDLFPSEDDWQVIKDLRVLEAAKDAGDDHSVSRRIAHWAYFAEEWKAKQFAQWAKDQGYRVQPVADTGDGDRKFMIQFSHEGNLHLNDITSHTIAARRKASELDGDYDGWETPVCKDANDAIEAAEKDWSSDG